MIWTSAVAAARGLKKTHYSQIQSLHLRLVVHFLNCIFSTLHNLTECTIGDCILFLTGSIKICSFYNMVYSNWVLYVVVHSIVCTVVYFILIAQTEVLNAQVWQNSCHSYLSPLKPGWQMQFPVMESQRPWRQRLHWKRQSSPNVPSGHDLSHLQQSDQEKTRTLLWPWLPVLFF